MPDRYLLEADELHRIVDLMRHLRNSRIRLYVREGKSPSAPGDASPSPHRSTTWPDPAR